MTRQRLFDWLFVLCAPCVVLGLVALLVWYQHKRTTAPCEAFASYAITDMPARCIDFYRGGNR